MSTRLRPGSAVFYLISNEWLFYPVILVASGTAAVGPHIVAYLDGRGWSYGGWSLPLSILGLLVCELLATAAFVNAFVRPRVPRVLFGTRIALVAIAAVAPFVVSSLLGGLATSRGKGFADAIANYTPLSELQIWAEATVARQTRSQAQVLTLPNAIVHSWPEPPDYVGLTTAGLEDTRCVEIRWGIGGLLVGPPDFAPGKAYFFLRTLRPGVYVFVRD